MRTSWIDLELSAVFGGWTLPETEQMLESGLDETTEAAILLELAKIELIVAERRKALTAQSAAKARAFRVLRRSKVASA